MGLQAFLSRRIVTSEGIRPGALIVDGEKIESVVPQEQVAQRPEIRKVDTRDFGNAAILPGLVDSHVHLNDPGRAEWEGFETGTQAAAAGGYTFLVDMPLNCLPATTTVEALEAKREAAKGRCWVDWAAWGGVVSDNQKHIEALAEAGVRGFKCFLIHPGINGFAMVTEHELREALPYVARTGLPLLVHAELTGPVDTATGNLGDADWTKYSTYLQSRPDEAELQAIRLLLSLRSRFKFRLHIVHLATAEAFGDLRQAHHEGVTVETCPHYLHLAAEGVRDLATLCKCAPPIRSQANREKLWEGLRDGLIDLIATDHSPCPPAMKGLEEGNFQTAWGGISSLSVALPVVWTEASRRGFGLTDIVRWMAEEPAKLAGVQDHKSKLEAGYDADFVVLDPDGEFTVEKNRLHYRHPVSPYLGEKLRGVVKTTYLRGQAVFSDGRFLGQARGREYPRE